jgi:hypothetical protein
MDSKWLDSVCVEALSFLSIPRAAKVEYFHGAGPIEVPPFSRRLDEFCNFCLGVLIVYSAYSNHLLDRFVDSNDADAILDVSHRINVFLCDDAWAMTSSSNFIEGDFWSGLARDAGRALGEIDERVRDEPYRFNFFELLRVDEFARP